MLKIATILPYKENYTKSKAGAASLWVHDFLKHSKYKKNNIIFGHTKHKDYLSENYININVDNLSSKFSSSTIRYCDNLIKKVGKKHFHLYEIHNRPLVFNYLKNKINSKFILYFHNDPLSMKGSKTVQERLFIINSVNKIIFISKWVQKRFFIGLSENLKNKTQVIYHSIKKAKFFKKKKKKIVFVGKLNYSKGYDLYVDAVVEILNKFPEWKAYSIGDESRKKPKINHNRHFDLGYLNHKTVLNFLSTCEIAVIPSRWEEPFGRTSLESSSRGCATILSNRGGLPETTDHGLILKTLTKNELYKTIKKLIEHNKFRRNLQFNGFNNVKHIIEKNSILIDDVRSEFEIVFNINYLKKSIRILNIYNLGQKLNHRIYNISIGKKFTNGFIRNNHDVLEISDRDFIKQNRQINFSNTYSLFQKYLIETFKNYNPNLIFFGHSNNISVDTFSKFKELNNNLVISQWNEDPMMPGLKSSNDNIKKMIVYKDFVDHTFITTDPKIFLNQNKNYKNVHFIFTPVDKNIEIYDVFNMKAKNDIFYAMSHGVNRGVLKEGKSDERSVFLNKLIKKISDISYEFYGFKDSQPIWGDQFFQALSNSKMGLNLSRGAPTKYYTSNRIASLMGNGLLTFIDKRTKFNDIFTNNEIVLYSGINDLASKIKFYKNNDKVRKKIASQGKKKYFKLFNEQKISKYIIEKSFGKESSLF